MSSKTTKLLSIVTLLGVFTSPALLKAATITVLTSVTPGTADIYYLPTSSFNSNVYTNAISTFGETFTTGSSAASYTLTDVVLEISHSYGNNDGNFSAPISIDSGSTVLDSETASITGSAPFTSDSGLDGKFIEITLSTPVVLAANTQYSFSIGDSTTGQLGGAGNGALAIAAGNGTLPNASGFSTGNGSGSTYGSNFVFDVGLTAVTASVPEPGTWALMLGGLGMLLFYQRRRASL